MMTTICPRSGSGLADRAETLFERLFDKPTRNAAISGDGAAKDRSSYTCTVAAARTGTATSPRQGGDMLAAILFAVSLDFVGALDWARSWLGMPRAGGSGSPSRSAGSTREPDEPQPDRQSKSADYDTEQAENSRRAGELSAAAWAIAGTVAETYLRQHRGIEAEAWPDALGFADAATVQRCTGWKWWRWPALLVRATDARGTVTGIQLVALQADGSAAKHWDHDGKLKLSFGTLAGAAVRLPGDDRALLLAEGPETALSCWWATGITTWCNLGSIARGAARQTCRSTG